MSDEAGPSSPTGKPGASASSPLEFAPLELTPLVMPPALAAQTMAPPEPKSPAVAPPPAPAETPAKKKARRRQLRGSIALSIAIHFAVAALLFVLFPPWHEPPPPEEPILRIDLREWHWIGDDPESEGTGPRGPGPNVPPPEPPKGREDAVPGFLDDDTYQTQSSGVGKGGSVVGSAFVGRVDGKEGLLAAGGGDGDTEGALRLALEWLARHQSPDGTWNADRFVHRCQAKGCVGRSDDEYVSATTALALLPFLGAGHTHRDGPWKDVVRRGLTALKDRQRADGSFDDGSKQGYADALATLALCEAFGLTQVESLGRLAQTSVDHLASAQAPDGGWRYDMDGRDADSSVTGWVAMALAAARKAGLKVPDGTLARTRGWFREHTALDGSVGYRSPGTGARSLLGVGYLVPVMLGASPDDPGLAATAGQLERSLPRWASDPSDAATVFGTADPMHWYYGALAAFQRGGSTWKRWHEKLRPLLLSHIERSGCPAGSWPAAGQTGGKGGRVVVTALCAMSLEVYYRYPRAVGR